MQGQTTLQRDDQHVPDLGDRELAPQQLQRKEREMEGNLEIIRLLSQLQCMDPI